MLNFFFCLCHYMFLGVCSFNKGYRYKQVIKSYLHFQCVSISTTLAFVMLKVHLLILKIKVLEYKFVSKRIQTVQCVRQVFGYFHTFSDVFVKHIYIHFFLLWDISICVISPDRKSTRMNSSQIQKPRMPPSA